MTVSTPRGYCGDQRKSAGRVFYAAPSAEQGPAACLAIILVHRISSEFQDNTHKKGPDRSSLLEAPTAALLAQLPAFLPQRKSI